MKRTFTATAPLSSDQTNVIWELSSQLRYPMNIMLLFINMKKMLGSDMEISLGTLKGILEK